MLVKGEYMIKFILHGGQTGLDRESNNKFFKEIAKSGSKVLLVYFAKPRKEWEEKSFQDMNRIQAACKTKALEYMVANPEIFEEQIEWSNVVYFRGGSGHLIIEPLRKIKNWNKLLDGKTVAGSSAGANVWAKYYYDQDYPETIEEGLGVLPIKTICHFGSGNCYGKDFELELEKLIAHKEDIETIPLREGEYTIISMSGPGELEKLNND